MSRKDNLIALRDAVVGGNKSLKVVPQWSKQVMMDALRASNGDMNTALTFMAEVLPDAAIVISVWPNCDWCVSLSGTHQYNGEHWHGRDDYTVNGRAATPSRALLIAALNALIEVEQDT